MQIFNEQKKYFVKISKKRLIDSPRKCDSYENFKKPQSIDQALKNYKIPKKLFNNLMGQSQILQNRSTEHTTRTTSPLQMRINDVRSAIRKVDAIPFTKINKSQEQPKSPAKSYLENMKSDNSGDLGQIDDISIIDSIKSDKKNNHQDVRYTFEQSIAMVENELTKKREVEVQLYDRIVLDINKRAVRFQQLEQQMQQMRDRQDQIDEILGESFLNQNSIQAHIEKLKVDLVYAKHQNLVLNKMWLDRSFDQNQCRKPLNSGLMQLGQIALVENAGEKGLCYSARVLDMLRVRVKEEKGLVQQIRYQSQRYQNINHKDEHRDQLCFDFLEHERAKLKSAQSQRSPIKKQIDKPRIYSSTGDKRQERFSQMEILRRESLKYEDFFRRLNLNKGKSYKPLEMVQYYNLLKDSTIKAQQKLTEFDKLISEEMNEVHKHEQELWKQKCDYFTYDSNLENLVDDLMCKLGWIRNNDPPPNIFLHKKVTKLTEENHELLLELTHMNQLKLRISLMRFTMLNSLMKLIGVKKFDQHQIKLKSPNNETEAQIFFETVKDIIQNYVQENFHKQ